MEENEEKFVSLFSDRYDNNLKIYVNKVMSDDPFFNRAYIQSNAFNLEEFERICKMLNVKIYLYAYKEHKELERYGYILYDKISTLLLESPYLIKGIEHIRIEKVKETKEWLDVYSAAFEDYRDEMENRLRHAKELELYTANIKDKTVGCMALLSSKSLLGLYCLGILPEFRMLGVASSLIRYAYLSSRERNLYLFLQTFLKDNLLRYYIKRGFVQMYIKYIYIKAS